MGADQQGKHELPTDLYTRARLFCDLPEQSLRIREFRTRPPAPRRPRSAPSSPTPRSAAASARSSSGPAPTVQSITFDLAHRVSSEVTSGLFGLAGVVLGFALNALAASRTRKQVTTEQRERERRERELVVAEHLDEALVRVSAALDRDTSTPVEERYQQAHDAWQEAWVSYSSRLRQSELLRRYGAVGSLLSEVVLNERTHQQIGRHIVARAIANARVLAFFMRGQDELPPTTFPEPAELRRLLAEGDALDDPVRPLKDWLGQHAMPDFHGVSTSELRRGRRGRRAPGHAS